MPQPCASAGTLHKGWKGELAMPSIALDIVVEEVCIDEGLDHAANPHCAQQQQEQHRRASLATFLQATMLLAQACTCNKHMGACFTLALAHPGKCCSMLQLQQTHNTLCVGHTRPLLIYMRLPTHCL